MYREIRVAAFLLIGFLLVSSGDALARGPLFLSGDNADSNCLGAACGRLYGTALNEVYAKSTSGGTGILSIGASGPAGQALSGWNNPANGGPNAPISNVNSANQISSVVFSNFKMIYVPSSSGLSQNQLNALNARKDDIRDFVVNAGGGVMALAEQGMTNAYAWFPATLTSAATTATDVLPTPHMFLELPAATASDANLDHSYRTKFSGNLGDLNVLASIKATGEAVILGKIIAPRQIRTVAGSGDPSPRGNVVTQQQCHENPPPGGGETCVSVQVFEVTEDPSAAGATGDGGAATLAKLNKPFGVIKTANFIHIADQANNTIRGVDLSGLSPTISSVVAGLNNPSGVAVLGGDLFIADTLNHRIVRFNLDSQTSTVVAGSGSPAGETGFPFDLWNPIGVAVNAAGNKLYIADSMNQVIREVDLASSFPHTIVNVAGVQGLAGYNGDGAATSRQLNNPTGVTLSGSKLFIADEGNSLVRMVDLSASPRTLTTVAGLVASGTPVAGFEGDNRLATAAKLNAPTGVAVSGNFLFIADTLNHRVRLVHLPTGVITTVAGSDEGFLDNTVATAGKLRSPTGVAPVSGTNFFIADEFNYRIREVYVPVP